MRFCHTVSFEDNLALTDKKLAAILKSIIKFENPDKIAKMIVKYANERGINVNQEYTHYAN